MLLNLDSKLPYIKKKIPVSKILLDVDFKFGCPKRFMKLQIQEIVWI